MKRTAVLISSLLAVLTLTGAQGLDPAMIVKPTPGSWPTYNGDYSGRRFSPLDQINATNVRNLSLAWVFHANTGPGGSPSGSQIKSTPLEFEGILYFTLPDHAWAVDARTGRGG